VKGLREWLAANVPVPRLSSVDTAEGQAAHRAWESKLFDAGWAVVTWPAEYGGSDASLHDWLTFEEEYWAADAPVRIGQNGLFLLAPTLFAHGTREQRDRILPRMARAEDVWAQAWSEPEAGSDLAAIRSTATPTDGGWLLNGQKTWSSRAAFADKAFGLFRSSGERHHGLTYLMFDLRAPGVTVHPIPQLNGEPGFAEIFLENVFVPEIDVIGEPGEGWKVAMNTASHERGLSLRSPGRFLATADRLVRLWQLHQMPTLRDRVVDAWIGAQAYRLHTQSTVDRLAEGGSLGAESSAGKVFWSELDLRLHETALDLLGGSADARWSDGYLFALAGPIYAGTNEVQRNVIAERLLGLPR
jgi:alkylation response protein AidB-like acyl-CoA dehydrogenase